MANSTEEDYDMKHSFNSGKMEQFYRVSCWQLQCVYSHLCYRKALKEPCWMELLGFDIVSGLELWQHVKY